MRACRSGSAPGEPAETARCAGQSVAVLLRYYAKVLDGEEAKMNALIEQGLAEHQDGTEGP